MLRISLLFISFGMTIFSIAQKTEKLPKSIRTSVEQLTTHLTQKCSSDRQKVDSIYTWITSNIDYDYKKIQSTSPFEYQTSEDVLKSGKAICVGYAELMQDMLQVVEIESEIIGGYSRKIEPGFNELLFEENHAWIAIEIDSEWHLADPTWDAGYIGRIPKKTKTYPKRWVKERTFTKATKKEKWDKQITEKKEKFDKKMSERDPYTDKIGFVRKLTNDYFLIHSDTFLLTHLPITPEWQLRENTITINQFSLPKDSVRSELEKPLGDTIDYQLLIEEYRTFNILEKWMYNGNHGYSYNEKNHGSIALGHYNVVGVYLDSDLKKKLKRFPDITTKPLWNDLLPLTDTAIVHAKQAYDVMKQSRKERHAYYKASFKQETSMQKAIVKEAGYVEKKIERINKSTTAENKRLKSDLKSIEEKIAKYAETVSKVELSNVKFESEIPELNTIYTRFTSFQEKIDSTKNSINSFREHSAQQGLLDAVSEARYHIEYANVYVSIYSISTIDSTANHDVKAIEALKKAQAISEDSVMFEIQSKELMYAVKNLERFVKEQKLTLKELEDTRVIKSASKIERQMKAAVLQRYREQNQLSLSSIAYHNYLTDNMEIIARAMNELTDRAEVLEKSRDERDEEIMEKSELDYERGENLYKSVQTNAKNWKTELKNRLK